tara:strand:- start:188 stop:1234 length:1047 start_codon:yes stop_codon:yes gene_type:complete
MAFDTEIQALAGTATQTEMDQWMADGAKEIINILPEELKIECATITALNSSTPMDLDATGKVFHVTRENADSGYHVGCRRVNPIYAGLADDSTSLHYVTVADPIYWIESDTGGDPKLFIKPTPTANQPARVHHVAFPSVDVSDVSSIVNFPNEAEYLVVLYAACKVLQNKMNELGTNTDVNTALSAVTTAVDQAATALGKFEAADADSIFGDEDTFLTANSQITYVRDALIKAQTLIDGATMGGDTEPQSTQYWLSDEDTEMAQATLQTAQTEIQRAQAEITHWTSIGDMRVKEIQAALSEAQGYAGEVRVRMERETQKYQWYQVQQVKLQQDYDKGVQALIGGSIQQ